MIILCFRKSLKCIHWKSWSTNVWLTNLFIFIFYFLEILNESFDPVLKMTDIQNANDILNKQRVIWWYSTAFQKTVRRIDTLQSSHLALFCGSGFISPQNEYRFTTCAYEQICKHVWIRDFVMGNMYIWNTFLKWIWKCDVHKLQGFSWENSERVPASILACNISSAMYFTQSLVHQQ